MISRLAFLGTFLATITAWAQTIITPCRPKLQWSSQVPLCNGQCPNSECAYRAPEFPAFAANWDEYTKFAQPGELYWDNTYWDNNDLHPIVLRKRLNRCPNCNTAFWQDPEPTK